MKPLIVFLSFTHSGFCSWAKVFEHIVNNKCQQPYLSTYFAYRVHQCSFETGGRDPRSPFHHSWELDCCTPSSSTVYTLFHRLTTCSNLSRHHPLEGTDGDHGNERRKKRGFRRRRLKITDSIIS